MPPEGVSPRPGASIAAWHGPKDVPVCIPHADASDRIGKQCADECFVPSPRCSRSEGIVSYLEYRACHGTCGRPEYQRVKSLLCDREHQILHAVRSRLQ